MSQEASESIRKGQKAIGRVKKRHEASGRIIKGPKVS